MPAPSQNAFGISTDEVMNMTVGDILDRIRDKFSRGRNRLTPEERYFLPDGYKSDERQREVAKLLVERLKQHRANPEIAPAGTLSRSRISLDDLSDDDLRRAGFVPSYVAVPETGQSQIATYRHPFSGMHFHKHKKNWMFHEDKYASLQMLMRKYDIEHPNASSMDRLKYFMKDALPYSAGHIVHEGTPGYVNYVNNTILGRKGFFDEGPVNPGRAVLGSLAATAVGTGLGAAATGKVRPITAGGGVGGFLLGNVLGDYIGNKAVAKDPKYGMPSWFNTGARAGIPILSTVAGAYLGNLLERKLREKRKRDKKHKNPR